MQYAHHMFSSSSPMNSLWLCLHSGSVAKIGKWQQDQWNMTPQGGCTRAGFQWWFWQVNLCFPVRIAQMWQSSHLPTRENICHKKSLTQLTSVVISIMICTLPEKSSSSSIPPLSSLPSLLLSTVNEKGTTSLRTRVLPNKTVFSWMQIHTWMVVVTRDHNWPVTVHGFSQCLYVHS